MKKIVEYRKLLNVEKTVSLKELKTIYRNSMKESHPDKFQGDDAGLKAAEESSKSIIEAYHFLVSINPETIMAGLPEYKETTATATITDYKYENIEQAQYVMGSFFGSGMEASIKENNLLIIPEFTGIWINFTFR